MPVRMSTQSPGPTAERQRDSHPLSRARIGPPLVVSRGSGETPMEWFRDNLPCLTKDGVGRRFRGRREAPGTGGGASEIGDRHAQG